MKTIHVSHGNGQSGFTLVELMVALVITLFVLAGLFMAFQTNRETFKFNEKLLRLQDSGRFALESIVRDLRMAGDVGCIRSALDQEDEFPALAGKVRLADGFAGFTGLDRFGITNSDIPKKLVQGLDWDGQNLMIYGIPVDGSTTTTLWSDCNESVVGGDTRPNSNTDYRTLTGYRFYTFEAVPGTNPVTYTIMVQDSSTPPNQRPTLLENVEKFAICFGVDDSGTSGGAMKGNKIRWLPLLGSSDIPSEPDFQRTTAVKIQMVVASELDKKGTMDDALSVDTSKSYTFCDSTKNYTSPSDRRLRKRFSAIVTLRNKVPNGYGPNGWLEAQ